MAITTASGAKLAPVRPHPLTFTVEVTVVDRTTFDVLDVATVTVSTPDESGVIATQLAAQMVVGTSPARCMVTSTTITEVSA